ncbi:Gfo/Idh/MocA family protein [Streptomyces monomycini]|uniref:Gfo/Idh/MocA family protein n=1 Tax=Streptomyces monomycini TaxID=371720 RepID=UPI001EEAFD0B|nr:Gfo/Idh/MocA family oxidoreductase [Streptomyces monomycini]
MSAVLRFGIIGCGVLGSFLGRLLTHEREGLPDAARLTAVAGRDPQRTKDTADALGCDPLTVTDLLARPDIDAVVVCTPSGTHAELGVRALRAGKHVLVEKPIDVTPEAADRLLRAARETGLTLGVVSQHRFDPAVRIVKSAVDNGRFGRLTSLVVELPWWREQAYYAVGSWRGTRELDGGGALINQAVHLVDLAQWLAGPVTEATAHTGLLAHHDIEVEDVATASLRFACGAQGVLLATTAAYPGRTARLAVHGDRGSAVIDNDELVYFHAARDGEHAAVYGAFDAGNQVADILPRQRTELVRDRSGLLYQPHRDQIADFCAAVREGRPPLADGPGARRALEAVTAVYASARAGTAVRTRHDAPTDPAGSADRPDAPERTAP